MKSSDITDIISEILENNSNERSVLIDGKWGCGKTHAVNDVLKDHGRMSYDIESHDKQRKKKQTSATEPRVYYVSLFGAATINDVSIKVNDLIGPTLWKNVHESLSFSSTVLKNVPGLNIVGDICNGLDLVLKKDDDNSFDRTKISKNITIIFDDIERTEKDFSYISFLGFINNLLISGAKVICICCSDNIEKYHPNGNFLEFKEKAFDRIYTISEPLNDVLYEIFDSFKIEHSEIDLLNDIFDSNLRIAKKTASFMQEITCYLKEKNVDYTKRISSISFLTANLCTIKIVLEHYGKTEGLDDDYQKLEENHIRNYKEKYNKVISDLPIDLQENFVYFLYYYRDNVFIKDSDVFNLCIALIFYYLNDDSRLADFFDVNFKSHTNMQINDMKYMSYEENERFSKEYINKIKNDSVIFKTKEDIDLFDQFSEYSVLKINDKETELIAKKIASEIPDLSLIRESYYSSDSSSSFVFNKVKTEFLNVSHISTFESLAKDFNEAHYNDFNQKLKNFISNKNISDESKECLLSKMADVNYFLPDCLSDEIDKIQWQCYESICTSMHGHDELLNKYVDYLESLTIDNENSVISSRVSELIFAAKY